MSVCEQGGKESRRVFGGAGEKSGKCVGKGRYDCERNFERGEGKNDAMRMEENGKKVIKGCGGEGSLGRTEIEEKLKEVTRKTVLVDEVLCRRVTREKVQVVVRMKSERDKEEVLIKRREMREKGAALDEDLMWLEVRVRWKMVQKGQEREKRRRVKVENWRIWIDEVS